jgi:outer membrane protein assembly factor BamE (lipoprotein component of BamABCDE complex)
VVILRFDQRGTLREIRRLGMEDGREIAAVSRTTPSPGTERSFLQQLFGNIGRVGPGVSGGQSTGPGAPSSGGR